MIELIAEIGVNHEGSQERALDSIKDLAKAGCTHVKFQTYKADELAAHSAESYWDTNEEDETSQLALFQKHECYSFKWYYPLYEKCNELGIKFMTSCFSTDLVDLFDDIVSCHKISSSDMTNKKLIRKILSKGKKTFISTGAAEIEEVSTLKRWIDKNWPGNEIIFMHCVLNYPTDRHNANLGRIRRLQDICGVDSVGYSCHVAGKDGFRACEIAYSMGVRSIEKHYSPCTLREGNDHYHALDARGFRDLLDSFKYISEMSLSSDNILSQQSARENARRGLYWAKSLNKGTKILDSHVIPLRPLKGSIDAWNIDSILGLTLKKDVISGNPCQTTQFEGDVK